MKSLFTIKGDNLWPINKPAVSQDVTRAIETGPSLRQFVSGPQADSQWTWANNIAASSLVRSSTFYSTRY